MRRPGSRLVRAIIVAVLVSAMAPAAIAQAEPATGATGAPGAGETASLADALEHMASQLDDLRRAAVQLVDEQRADSDAPSPQALARVVRSGPRSSGAVALTFDDGYDRAVCAHIADTLREHGAVGTFFVNGMHLQGHPQRWREILEGMQVGNHTRSHHDLMREPHPVVIHQIMHNEAIHERVLGRPMSKLLRPPYGAYGERIQAIAAQLGYEQLVLWSVDTDDWMRSTSKREIVRRATRAGPGSIILMHCSRAATARALPAIIRHYQSRGITLAGLDEVLRTGTDETPTSEGASASRLLDS
jgi:peptidoglycan/xylan/chitin deacetylase (PgdA/CDA1 family)